MNVFTGGVEIVLFWQSCHIIWVKSHLEQMQGHLEKSRTLLYNCTQDKNDLHQELSFSNKETIRAMVHSTGIQVTVKIQPNEACIINESEHKEIVNNQTKIFCMRRQKIFVLNISSPNFANISGQRLCLLIFIIYIYYVWSYFLKKTKSDFASNILKLIHKLKLESTSSTWIVIIQTRATPLSIN